MVTTPVSSFTKWPSNGKKLVKRDMNMPNLTLATERVR